MLGNKRIAHTIHDHLVAGLLLVCMAGIGESAYAQVQATGGIVSIEPVTTSRTINEAGGTYEFDVVFEFLPTNATFFRGTRRVALGFSGGRLTTGGASVNDPRVTPTQDYSVSVEGVEQTLTATRPTRLGTIYELPFASIEFGSGSVMGDPLPADRRLTRRIVLTAKDDGVDEGPNTTPGTGTEAIMLVFNPQNPDGAFLPPAVGITYGTLRFPIFILDNDSNPPGVTVTPTTLTTTEGGTATFTVVLDSEPAGYETHSIPNPITGLGGTSSVPVYELTNEVRVTVTSTDPGGGGLVSSVGITPAISTVLTFTDDDGAMPWDTPQSVTVNGVDNLVSGSDVIYDITFDADGGTFTPGSEGRTDHDYDGVTVAAVSVTNTDNDGMHGVIVTEPGGSTSVAENGGTDTFTVALRSEPTDDVILTLTSSDTNEGTVLPATLTFTRTGGTTPWNTPQTVTLTGVNDDIDSDDTFTVDFAITDGDGVNYPITPSIPTVTVTATNDDTASTNITLAISPTSVAEAVGTTEITITATLDGTVALATPTDVRVTVGDSGDSANGGIDYQPVDDFTLTIPPLMTSATGTFTTTLSIDADNNDETITISGTVSGFTVTPTTLTISEVGLSAFRDASGGIPVGTIIGANEGVAHTFYVRLTRQPTGNVVVTPTSRDPTELAINTPSLTFNTTNWNMRQAVVVTSVDDDVFRTDSPEPTASSETYDYEVDFAVTSGDGNAYSDALTLSTVRVRVTDDDRVTLVLSASPTNILEGTGPTTITVTAILTGSTRVSRQITQNLQLIGDGGAIGSDVASLAPGPLQDASVTSLPDPITIPPLGDRGTTTFEIDPLADSRDEDRERVTIDNDGRGYGVMDALPVDVFIVETGILVFETLTGDTLIDTVTIANENNGTNTFYAELASQPAAGSSVVIGVASSDTNEGTVSPETLTFTAADWNMRQPVTVTAVDDNIIRDDSFMVNFEITTGDGGVYPLGPTLPSVEVMVTNDDIAGIAVDVTSVTPVVTTEGDADFQVLNVQLPTTPTHDVTVTIQGLDPTEHTAWPPSITLSIGRSPEFFTISSVDDDLADGAVAYTATLLATSADPVFDGETTLFSLINQDNEASVLFRAGRQGSILSSYTTTEGGIEQQIGVALTSQPQPAVDVTFSVTVGGDSDEITINPQTSTRTFTSANYDTPMIVALTPVNDTIVDGNRPYTIDLTVTASTMSSNYPVGMKFSLPGINEDNETPPPDAIPDTTAPTLDSTMLENNTVTLTYSEELDPISVPSPAAYTLTVAPTPTTGNELTLSDVSILGQNVILTLSRAPTGNESLDLTYVVPSANPVQDLATTPNPAAAFADQSVKAAGLSVSIANVTVDEDVGDAEVTVTVAGTSTAQITATVTTANGTATVTEDYTAPSNSLTIGAGETTATITIPIIDDNIDEGISEDFTVTLSNLGGGGGLMLTLDKATATVTITDDDTAALIVDIGDGVSTSEDMTTDSFTVALGSQPTANVMVLITGIDASEHVPVAPALSTLTFTFSDWATAQQVTLRGEEDTVADGDQTYDLTLMPIGGGYDGITQMVSVTNTDNDTAALTIADTTIDENAGTATVTVTLTPAVTAGDVMVDLTTADGTATGADYTAITSETLTFVAGSTSETLDITISDDSIAEGNENFTVMLNNLVQPTGVTTVSIADATAEVTIIDDDTAALALFEESTSGAGSTAVTSITTGEPDVATTFYVELTSAPTADVTVAVTSDDTTEGTITTGTSLTFTTGNWNVRQAVIVTGQDDSDVDGDQTYTVTLNPASSDTNYNGLTETLNATNTDDDSATTLSIADTSVNENAGIVTMTVTLTPAVTAGTVEVDLTTMDATATSTDYTAITSQTLTFVAGSTTQTLNIPINDDSIAEGDETFTVMLDNLMLPTGVTTVSITDATATVTIIDDDVTPTTIDLEVTPTTVAETADATTITVTATLDGTVVLPTTTDVAVTVGGGTATVTTDYTATPSTLTIMIPAEAASATQTFMITPVNDTTVEGEETVMISGTSGSFTVNATTLTIVEAGILVFDMATGNTTPDVVATENGGTDMFYVELASQPASDVTLSVESDDTNEGMVTPATLTFTILTGICAK